MSLPQGLKPPSRAHSALSLFKNKGRRNRGNSTSSQSSSISESPSHSSTSTARSRTSHSSMADLKRFFTSLGNTTPSTSPTRKTFQIYNHHFTANLNLPDSSSPKLKAADSSPLSKPKRSSFWESAKKRTQNSKGQRLGLSNQHHFKSPYLKATAS